MSGVRAETDEHSFECLNNSAVYYRCHLDGSMTFLNLTFNFVELVNIL